jgi:thiamine-phosphate pyrophosphorylase
MTTATALLFLFSDRHRCADWRAGLHRAGPHCGLILRDYDAPSRATMAAEMAAFCASENRSFSVAGTLDLAQGHYAGFHCPSYLLRRPLKFGLKDSAIDKSISSAAVHNLAELYAAKKAGIKRVFISPVFATNSHIGARGLGVIRAQNLARAAQNMGLVPLALGGMDAQKLRRLNGAQGLFAGLGAIDAFAKPLGS